MVNKVRVTIAGAPYAIATTDPEAYITSLAKKLDEDITKLLDDNANLSVTKAAVFCAMDYLDEYRKSAGNAENMRGQIQDYIADAARANNSDFAHEDYHPFKIAPTAALAACLPCRGRCWIFIHISLPIKLYRIIHGNGNAFPSCPI